MKADTMTLRVLTVPLPGGRVLRIALSLDEHGEPVDLCIAAGFRDAPMPRALAEGLSVPASALPALRDALAALDAQDAL
jgi:hypothetical protein